MIVHEFDAKKKTYKKIQYFVYNTLIFGDSIFARSVYPTHIQSIRNDTDLRWTRKDPTTVFFTYFFWTYLSLFELIGTNFCYKLYLGNPYFSRTYLNLFYLK